MGKPALFVSTLANYTSHAQTKTCQVAYKTNPKYRL